MNTLSQLVRALTSFVMNGSTDTSSGGHQLWRSTTSTSDDRQATGRCESLWQTASSASPRSTHHEGPPLVYHYSTAWQPPSSHKAYDDIAPLDLPQSAAAPLLQCRERRYYDRHWRLNDNVLCLRLLCIPTVSTTTATVSTTQSAMEEQYDSCRMIHRGFILQSEFILFFVWLSRM